MGVIEIPPCGTPLALVYNVAELFGIAFSEILDSSCDEDFMERFTSSGCSPCLPREVLASGIGGAFGLDSDNVGDCKAMDSRCDVRSVQTVTLNNVERAASIVQAAYRSVSARS